MTNDPFANCISILTRHRPPRVWSLLVTVFGDVAQGPNDVLSGALLGKITASISIKPEATRVALHRLRKDDWIESTKRGRNSYYQLTQSGRSQSAAASPLIYGSDGNATSALLIVCDPQATKSDDRDRYAIGANTYLGNGNATTQNSLSVPLRQADDIPDWAKNRLCRREIIEECAQVMAQFSDVQKQMLDRTELSPFEIAVLRVLIVHAWRRIVLRSPRLPDFVFPDGWVGPECRALVGELLTALPVPTIEALETGMIN